MTDPFAALHGPRRAAPSGGAERAMTTGRRRIARRRTAGAAAGVSVAVVAGVAVAARPQASDRLLPSGTVPTSTASSSRAKDAPPTPLPTVSLPAVPPVVPGGPGTPPPPPGEPSATAEPTAPAPDASRRWIGPSTNDVVVTTKSDPAACAAVPEYAETTSRTGFCTMLSGPATVTVGTAATFAFTLCHAAGTQPKTLTYDTRVEAAFGVSRSLDSGTESVWYWGNDAVRAPHRHTVTFAAGDCRTWAVVWRGQDTDGWAVPDGEYQMDAAPVPFDWVDENGAEVGPPPTFLTLSVSGA
jgi:hypothetical protein